MLQCVNSWYTEIQILVQAWTDGRLWLLRPCMDAVSLWTARRASPTFVANSSLNSSHSFCININTSFVSFRVEAPLNILTGLRNLVRICLNYFWTGWGQGRPSPLNPMMDIGNSHYFHTICKFLLFSFNLYMFLPYLSFCNGVDELERSWTPFRYLFLAGTRVPALIFKSAGTLSTYRSGTYLQKGFAEMMIMNLWCSAILPTYRQ